jgi:hypothetical protein
MLFLAALIPAVALAASPWDGTWKTKLDTLKVTGKPDAYELSGGNYQCLSCVPPVNVPADGKDHAVTGHSYYDSFAVRVIDAASIEGTGKLKGKVTFTDKMSVSADHNTLTHSIADHTGAALAKYDYTSKRVAAGKAGAHAVSGQWQQGASTSASDNAVTLMIATSDNGIKMTYNGLVTDAKFDGKPVPVTGDPGHTMAALKKLSADTIEETDTRDGKVTDVTRTTLAKDGKSLQVVDQDKLHGTTTSFTMIKAN